MDCLADIDVAIFCGGRGRRFSTTFPTTPKSLLPIGQTTVLDVIVNHLRQFGARHFVLLAGHLGEQISDWATEKMDSRDVEIDVTVQMELTGTGDAIKWSSFLLKSDPVLVLNGDVLTNANLCQMMRVYHMYGHPLESVALYARRHPGRNIHNAGYYLVSQRLLRGVDRPQFDMYIGKHTHDLGQFRPWTTSFLDIGTPKTLAMAEDFVADMKAPDWLPQAIRA